MDEARYRDAERRLWDAVGLRPEEVKVGLSTTRTAARIQVVGEGDPVLFIHGGPNAGSTWAPIMPFMGGFRCLLVDRPGTGLSEPYAIDPGNLPTFGEEFIGDVLDGMGIDSAHVVGSSFGGHLALRSAAAASGRIRRMVQMAAPALVPGERLPPFIRLFTIGWLRAVINALPPNERANTSILRQIGHGASLEAGRIPRYFFDWYMDLARYTDTMRNDGEMIGSLGSIRGLNESVRLTPELLGSVATPTLFLWGSDDGFGGEDQAQRITSYLPNAELVMIAESGHLPWLDFPEEVGKATAEFLSRS